MRYAAKGLKCFAVRRGVRDSPAVVAENSDGAPEFLEEHGASQ